MGVGVSSGGIALRPRGPADRTGTLAVAAIIDPAWCAKQLTSSFGSIADIAKEMERLAPDDARSCVNPLLDLAYIADRYFGDRRLSALEVVVRYATDLLPKGVSPHPLIDAKLFRICRPEIKVQERSGAIRSWAEALFKGPDQSGNLIAPFIDPTFVLREAGLNHSDLASRGASSVSRLYLGEAARNGIRPHPLFDPVYVHAKRTGGLPSRESVKDPGSFLVAEFGAYIQQAGKQQRASPSIGFDENLLRANRFVAGAIRRRLYANAFHAYVANSGRMASQPLTESGIHAFPVCVTPRAWWKLEKDFALRRCRGRDLDSAFLKVARQRLSKQRPAAVRAHIEGDLPHAVKLGQKLSIIIHGFAASPRGRLAGVEIKVGDRKGAGSFQGAPRPDAAASIGSICPPAERMFCGFAIAWNGTAEEIGGLPVAIRFRLAGRGRARLTGWIDAGAIAVKRPLVRLRTGRPSQVAIAMATYNPKPEQFRAQLESIRAQTLTDWCLEISDESTDDNAREAIRRIVSGDPRIRLENGPHLGFVGNFERALDQLDRRSPYFALSDQDDVWYPRKLDTLVEAIERERTALVYGGMRIVSEDGRVLEDSFFSWRRRHGHSTDELILANTVTGAACLGRMGILRDALPIPRYNGVFHDMWLALVASRGGGIAYVNDTLQDYVQHSANVLGQSGAGDRLSAASFARHEKNFRRLKEQVLKCEGDIHMTPSTQLKILSALAAISIDAIQREFLSLAINYRFDTAKPKDPLALARLRAEAERRAAIGSRRDKRKFLNIPSCLVIGTDLLEQISQRRDRCRTLARAALADRSSMINTVRLLR